MSTQPESNEESPFVRIGQLWKRKNGVVYKVADERDGFSRDVFLIPVTVPPGIKARKTWKWDVAVRAEMVCLDETSSVNQSNDIEQQNTSSRE